MRILLSLLAGRDLGVGPPKSSTSSLDVSSIEGLDRLKAEIDGLEDTRSRSIQTAIFRTRCAAVVFVLSILCAVFAMSSDGVKNALPSPPLVIGGTLTVILVLTALWASGPYRRFASQFRTDVVRRVAGLMGDGLTYDPLGTLELKPFMTEGLVPEFVTAVQRDQITGMIANQPTKAAFVTLREREREQGDNDQKSSSQSGPIVFQGVLIDMGDAGKLALGDMKDWMTPPSMFVPLPHSQIVEQTAQQIQNVMDVATDHIQKTK